MNHYLLTMAKSKIYLLFFIILCKNSFAGIPLNEEIVIHSAMSHYPKIYISEEKIRLAESKFQEAKGEFDSSISLKQRQFLSGYYENTAYFESKVEKPLPFFNSKIYAGYLKSQNGEYPEINQYYNTKSDGRAIFGFEFSLLRGFLINERNAIRNIAELEVKVAEYNNFLMQSQVKADAKKAYWKCVYTKKIFDVYQEVLNIALKRQKILEAQVKNGDKARIVLDENKRVILRRQSLIENIKRELLNNAINLSMYVRNEDGTVYDAILIAESVNSDEFNLAEYTPNLKNDMKMVLNNRIDIKILEVLLSQGKIKMKLAKNDILPKLDLTFEQSKDFGTGYIQKNEPLNKVALNVSIPLENKKQVGKFGKMKSDVKIIENEVKFLKDIIKNEVMTVFNKIDEIKQVLKNTKEEILIGEKLLSAENLKFENGDSDFFMINAREQDLLSVREYNLRNQLALAEVLIEYKFMVKDSLL